MTLTNAKLDGTAVDATVVVSTPKDHSDVNAIMDSAKTFTIGAFASTLTNARIQEHVSSPVITLMAAIGAPVCTDTL